MQQIPEDARWRVDEDPEDGWDDLSYAAGYQAGLQIGLTTVDVNSGGFDGMDLSLFDLDNNGVIDYREMEILNDLSVTEVLLTSNEYPNNIAIDQGVGFPDITRDDTAWKIPFINENLQDGYYSTGNIKPDYYNRQILKQIISRII